MKNISGSVQSWQRWPGAADDLDVSELAARLRALITDFLTDMHHEEQFLLTRDVLRNDLVSVDQDCG